MTMHETIDLIKMELSRIQKPGWINAILKLEENFRDYPFDDESQSPASAIYDILKNIDPLDSPDERFISRVRQIDAFTYRAYFTDREMNAIYWNPLFERFNEFSKNKSIEYQADMEYPATDIIRKWLYTQINQA
jgi:hypothetical protein